MQLSRTDQPECICFAMCSVCVVFFFKVDARSLYKLTLYSNLDSQCLIIAAGKQQG